MAQSQLAGCQDRRGQPIETVTDTMLRYAAMAGRRDARPAIVWNERLTRRLSRVEQLFLYLHECAHHTLGHLDKPLDLRWEIEADCWAVQLLVDGGMLKGAHVSDLQRERRSVRGDELHQGGVEHVRTLRECLTIRTDRRAWARALDGFVRSSRDSFVGIRGEQIDVAATGPVFESLWDAPGTYDCEITGNGLRCLVFAARAMRRAEGRFAELVSIVRAWMPPNWVPSGGAAADPKARAFHAIDGATGTRISLLLTSPGRVHFVVRPGSQ